MKSLPSGLSLFSGRKGSKADSSAKGGFFAVKGDAREAFQPGLADDLTAFLPSLLLRPRFFLIPNGWRSICKKR